MPMDMQRCAGLDPMDSSPFLDTVKPDAAETSAPLFFSAQPGTFSLKNGYFLPAASHPTLQVLAPP